MRKSPSPKPERERQNRNALHDRQGESGKASTLGIWIDFAAARAPQGEWMIDEIEHHGANRSLHRWDPGEQFHSIQPCASTQNLLDRSENRANEGS